MHREIPTSVSTFHPVFVCAHPPHYNWNNIMSVSDKLLWYQFVICKGTVNPPVLTILVMIDRFISSANIYVICSLQIEYLQYVCHTIGFIVLLEILYIYKVAKLILIWQLKQPLPNREPISWHFHFQCKPVTLFCCNKWKVKSISKDNDITQQKSWNYIAYLGGKGEYGTYLPAFGG